MPVGPAVDGLLVTGCWLLVDDSVCSF